MSPFAVKSSESQEIEFSHAVPSEHDHPRETVAVPFLVDALTRKQQAWISVLVAAWISGYYFFVIQTQVFYVTALFSLVLVHRHEIRRNP